MLFFNIPLSIFVLLGFFVLFGLFASATLLASEGRKLEDVSNPYENFLFVKMLRLTKQSQIIDLVIFTFFIVLLWPFHTILLALGLFYTNNKN